MRILQWRWIRLRGCAEGRGTKKPLWGIAELSRAPLVVHINLSPSASDALKDQWRQTVRSNATVLAELVNKQCFQKKACHLHQLASNHPHPPTTGEDLRNIFDSEYWREE